MDYNQARDDAKNSFQRNNFLKKFPDQCEHMLRLISERLHLGLDKRDGADPADPRTWKLSSVEIMELSQALYYVNEVRVSLND
jgi:hypothetical protein